MLSQWDVAIFPWHDDSSVCFHGFLLQEHKPIIHINPVQHFLYQKYSQTEQNVLTGFVVQYNNNRSKKSFVKWTHWLSNDLYSLLCKWCSVVYFAWGLCVCLISEILIGSHSVDQHWGHASHCVLQQKHQFRLCVTTKATVAFHYNSIQLVSHIPLT